MSRISTMMVSQRALTVMLNQQSRLSDTQNQLSTGRRVLTPADDPASAARVLDLNRAVETVRQYQSNADRAQGRLETEEGILAGITNLLQRVNELAIRGNNATLTQVDAEVVATEVRQLLDNLLGLANSRDGNGEFVFAGYQTNGQPFSRSGNGAFAYTGDLGQRMLQISPDRQIADGNNGYEVLMDVQTGPVATMNADVATVPLTAIDAGDITIDGGNGNGPVSLGAIPAAASATQRAAQLRSAINAVSDRTGVHAVTATATNSLTLTGVGGSGIEVGLMGTANSLNTVFTAPSVDSVTGKQSIFETLDQLAQTLERDQPVDRYIADVQLALEHVVEVRTTVGARLSAIDEQVEVNSGFELSLETHRSNEQDLDYAEAIARFQQQMVALQAAQQAFVKVQSLSLFNYL